MTKDEADTHAPQAVPARCAETKSHGHDDAHDPTQVADWWFQESAEGLVLFVVFYTQACRWSKCLGCNLASLSASEHVPYPALMAQVDHLFADPRIRERADDIRKVIASNNGSILDQETFSSTALMYFLARLNITLPKMRVLSIESRPEHVEFAELEFLARAIAESEGHTELEIAIGFEAYDDRVRNQVYCKGLERRVFEDLVRTAAPYGYHLKCYFMLKPVPEMSDADAVTDIQQAIDYLDERAGDAGIPINMHLNPTFVARGTALEGAFHEGRYRPPRLTDLAAAAHHSRDKRVSIFLGLSDEGLAVEGGSFVRPGEEALVSELERFNRTQDYAILERILRDATPG